MKQNQGIFTFEFDLILRYYTPMEYERDYITKEKKAELEQELEILRSTKRREILTQLEYAKSLGDLSENAEYHEARELQGKNEDRIKIIDHILRNSVVMSENRVTDMVVMGSTVTVVSEDGKEKVFQIVGKEDADLMLGRISHHSPIGQALFGGRVGDNVEFTTPKGVTIYKIKEIR